MDLPSKTLLRADYFVKIRLNPDTFTLSDFLSSCRIVELTRIAMTVEASALSIIYFSLF